MTIDFLPNNSSMMHARKLIKINDYLNSQSPDVGHTPLLIKSPLKFNSTIMNTDPGSEPLTIEKKAQFQRISIDQTHSRNVRESLNYDDHNMQLRVQTNPTIPRSPQNSKKGKSRLTLKVPGGHSNDVSRMSHGVSRMS